MHGFIPLVWEERFYHPLECTQKHITEIQTSESKKFQVATNFCSIRIATKHKLKKKYTYIDKIIKLNTCPTDSIESGFSDSTTSAGLILSSKSNKNAVFCNWIGPYPIFPLSEGTDGRDAAVWSSITLRSAEVRSDLSIYYLAR